MQSQGYTGERFLVGFYSDPAPHKGGVIFLGFFLLVVFDGNITSKTLRSLLSLSDSTCYTVFVLISVLFSTTFSPASLSLFSSYIKISLSALFGHCIQGEFKVTLKYHTSCEVDHTCVWSQSLKKKSWGEIFLASFLPFLLRHSPCPIWSNLEPEKRGETVWRWGDANNVAPHLMCLKCLWPVRPALWSATNLMVSEVQGDVEQTDRRKKILAHGSTLESQEARTTEEKVYLVSCYVLEILSTTLNYVSSF